MVEKFRKTVNIRPEQKLFPDELMAMYRHRSGLTQGQLAVFLGLKGYRPVCNWEAGTNLPAPDKLKKLIEYYLFQGLFDKGQELADASRLWELVKDKFDLTCSINRMYPPFDKGWFTSLLLLQQRPAAAQPPSLPILRLSGPKILDLPVQGSRLLGREREVGELSALLKDPSVRLVTLFGPGGMGKTRLSQELAYNFAGYYRDGVRLVDLSVIQDAGQVPGAIARALLVEGGNEEKLVEGLKNYLSERELLLVLDNFEQVTETAGFVGELLGNAPGLKILVTSREVLGLAQEYIYELAPLPLPGITEEFTPEQAAGSGAVKLFVERGARVKAGFELTPENVAEVVSICRKLEGIPLALELTAGHLRFFSVTGLREMLDKSLLGFNTTLREKPVRHRTMRATIEWSYQLLSPEEQGFFRLLGLFNGGFTLPEVTAIYSRVVGRNFSELEVFEMLGGLSAKSLVRIMPGSEDRFGLFETIREFALDRLKSAGEMDRVGDCFAGYFLELVEKEGTERALKLGQGRKTLEQEYRNLLAALDWVTGQGQTELALKLSAAMGEFWAISAYLNDGRKYLEQALALPAADPTGLERAWAIFYLGNIFYKQTRYEDSLPLTRQCLETFRQQGDRRGMAEALLNIGLMYVRIGDIQESVESLEESLNLFKELQDELAIARALAATGFNYHYQGFFARSQKVNEEALALEQKLGNQSGIIDCLFNLGQDAFRQGDYERARYYCHRGLEVVREGGNKHQRAIILNLLSVTEGECRNYPLAIQYRQECHRIFLELGDQRGQLLTNSNLGRLYMEMGDFRKGRQYMMKALESENVLGNRQKLAYDHNNLALLELLSGRLALASGHQKISFEIEADLKDYIGIAFNLTGQAAVMTRQFTGGDKRDLTLLRRAAVLLGIVAAFLKLSAGALEWKFQELYDEAWAVAGRYLPAEEFKAAFARGKAMSLEEAVAFSLPTAG